LSSSKMNVQSAAPSHSRRRSIPLLPTAKFSSSFSTSALGGDKSYIEDPAHFTDNFFEIPVCAVSMTYMNTYVDRKLHENSYWVSMHPAVADFCFHWMDQAQQTYLGSEYQKPSSYLTKKQRRQRVNVEQREFNHRFRSISDDEEKLVMLAEAFPNLGIKILESDLVIRVDRLVPTNTYLKFLNKKYNYHGLNLKLPVDKYFLSAIFFHRKLAP
ncbi:Unknown protein, partial [Striga hermonthica]